MLPPKFIFIEAASRSQTGHCSSTQAAVTDTATDRQTQAAADTAVVAAAPESAAATALRPTALVTSWQGLMEVGPPTASAPAFAAAAAVVLAAVAVVVAVAVAAAAAALVAVDAAAAVAVAAANGECLRVAACCCCCIDDTHSEQGASVASALRLSVPIAATVRSPAAPLPVVLDHVVMLQHRLQLQAPCEQQPKKKKNNKKTESAEAEQYIPDP